MYQVLIDNMISRWFDNHVKNIHLSPGSGYEGDSVTNIPDGIDFGNDIIVTGQKSGDPLVSFVGKTSLVADLAKHLKARTLIDKGEDEQLTKNKDFVEEKTGAKVSDEPLGVTIYDLPLEYTIDNKLSADTVVYCFKDADLNQNRTIQVVDDYIRLIEVYGFGKVVPVCLKHYKE